MNTHEGSQALCKVEQHLRGKTFMVFTVFSLNQYGITIICFKKLLKGQLR